MTPKDEHYLSGTKPIPVEIYEPSSPGKHPVVLILHGSFGLLPQYRADIVSFAEALVENGIAAAMPHYLDSTGTDPGPGVFDVKVMSAHLPTWKNACVDALAFVAGDPRFDAAHLGVLGFSLGGHLALGIAMALPAGITLRSVVDFFGPTVRVPLSGDWSKLPQLFIAHGTLDPLVPITESKYLVTQLESVGKKKDLDFIFEPYKDEGHGFKGEALKKSRLATVEFLKKTL